MNMTKCLRPLLVGLSLASGLCAQSDERLRMVTKVALSPDGQSIAFAWQGDLWTAPIRGGDIARLTTHPARDSNPTWSPDGREIAFNSSRSGATQVWVLPAWGGSPRQITHDTDGQTLAAWPMREHLLVAAARDHHWRNSGRMWLQPLDSEKAPELLFNAYGENGSLSPDGNEVIFTREGTRTYRKNYYGAQSSQVWHYNRESGDFQELHRDKHGSRWPMWSDNGSTYYYVNQESGAWNLFRCSTANDEHTQLTSFTDDGVMWPSISRDGSTIVFFRWFDLYRMDTGTGEIARIALNYAGDPIMPESRRMSEERASAADITEDGREVAMVAGGDLWVMDTVLGEPKRVTDTAGMVSSQLWSADYESLYFVKDGEGRTDIWKATRKNADAFWWQNEEFTLERVTDDPDSESSLRWHPDGKRIAYHRNQSVWLLDTESGESTEMIASWNRPSYDFSPKGEWVVYSMEDDNFNDDVWIKPLDGSREPYNLSVHPDDDRAPVWSADGKHIAWTGRRWGTETDIVWVPLTKEDAERTEREKRMEEALKKMKGRKPAKKAKAEAPKKAEKEDEKPAAAKGETEVQAADAISGRWAGTLKGPPNLMPKDGVAVTAELIMDAEGGVTGSMSTPMGAGTVTSGRYDAATKELKLEFDDEISTRLQGKLQDDGSLKGTWANAMARGTFECTREGGSPKEEEAAEAKADEKAAQKAEKKDDDKLVIDFDGLRDRLRRISLPNSFERSLVFGPKGSKLHFSGTVGGKGGNWTVDLPEKPRPVSSKVGFRPGGKWILKGKAMATLSSGRPAIMRASGKTDSFAFTVRMERDMSAHHAAIFEQAWRTMRDRWYDSNYGKNDWNAIREKYRPMAELATTGAELGVVCNMMLGELNGSHLGFRYRGVGSPVSMNTNVTDQWRESTWHLGTRFDHDYEGPGLKVSDVVTGTPADRADSRIHEGEIILAVDGKAIDGSMNRATYMTAPSDHIFTVKVQDTEGETREVKIRGTRSSTVRARLYEDWMADNRAKVDELSDGKLGYLHIRGLGGANLLRFDSELYRIGAGKDGLIIDVRDNGGGSITDHLLTCLAQPTHAITRPRGGGEGYPHDRRIYATWNKPIIVLCNQDSFSNAEIFSHAIKTLGRGQVVGVPTAGGVISTGGAGLMDGAFVRVPFRGWFLMDGEDMEMNGCVPHHVMWPRPGELPAGVDRQLEKAVSVLSEDVSEWKARPRPTLRKATERSDG